MIPCSTRRDVLATSLFAPLVAATPLGLFTGEAEAAPDPAMTITKLPDEIQWEVARDRPPKVVESANLWSKTSEPGLYYYLVRWYPGYMSAPHWYEQDRYCVVVSGTWWVASGDKFDPEQTVPMPPGSFIRRVARTPHYDGVKKDGKEPAVIAICGIGPITYHNAEEGTPNWRAL